MPLDRSPEPALRFDLLILDLDGTLVDTREGIVDTFQATLALAGRLPPEREAILPFIGLPLDVMFRHFLSVPPTGAGATPVPGPDLDRVVASLIDAYRRRYHERVTPTTRPLPEVAETLATLQTIGIGLAVATSKLTLIAEQSLEAAGLLPLFQRRGGSKETTIYGMDAVARPKPAPDLALKVLAELGVPAGRSLVVGDAVHDIGMGRAAGCATCAVTYGAQSREEMLLARPDHLVDRFSEVLRLVRT